MNQAAKGQLVGRRLLHTEGPHGLGLKMVPMKDTVLSGGDRAPETVTSQSIPLALIRTTFTLGPRDPASYEQSGVELGVANIVEAAMACARLEDDLVLNGAIKVHAPGLLSAEGSKVALSKWEKPGDPWRTSSRE